ncbi:MAG: hypothetical protein QXM23_04755 [Archaeoglobaceae archaeon]
MKDYAEEANLRRKTKLAILITQLRNGSRISEAIEAIRMFRSTGVRERGVQEDDNPRADQSQSHCGNPEQGSGEHVRKAEIWL